MPHLAYYRSETLSAVALKQLLVGSQLRMVHLATSQVWQLSLVQPLAVTLLLPATSQQVAYVSTLKIQHQLIQLWVMSGTRPTLMYSINMSMTAPTSTGLTMLVQLFQMQVSQVAKLPMTSWSPQTPQAQAPQQVLCEYKVVLA